MTYLFRTQWNNWLISWFSLVQTQPEFKSVQSRRKFMFNKMIYLLGCVKSTLLGSCYSNIPICLYQDYFPANNGIGIKMKSRVRASESNWFR